MQPGGMSLLLQGFEPSIESGKGVAQPMRREPSRRDWKREADRAIRRSAGPERGNRERVTVAPALGTGGHEVERAVKGSGSQSGRGVSWTGSSIFLCVMVVALLSLRGAERAAAAGQGPVWTAGRATVEVKADRTGQRRPVLKISLRNQGSPGRAPVQLFGRWARHGKLERMNETELRRLARLGRFAREVALKRTAIVEVPLTPLRRRPRGSPGLELVIQTGSRITDHRLVSMR